MTKEEIINSIHIDKANLEYIAKTGKINGTLASELNRCFDQYAQQIILDKLPGDLSIESHWHDVSDKFGAAMSNYQADEGFEGWKVGMKQMRTIATQRITTMEDVEKPYRDALMEIAGIALPFMSKEQKERINELLKR